MGVTAHITTASTKTNAFIHLTSGPPTSAIHAVWRGVQIKTIDQDEELASKGQVKVIARGWHSLKVLRSSAFAKVELQVA